MDFHECCYAVKAAGKTCHTTPAQTAYCANSLHHGSFPPKALARATHRKLSGCSERVTLTQNNKMECHVGVPGTCCMAKRLWYNNDVECHAGTPGALHV
eukprot:scaffold222935_cov19-Tisochrysis_lutea.AAC.1